MSSETPAKPIAIQCPHCQKKLKIEDPRLLGKKVKCPGCKVSILLEPPRPQPKTVAPREEDEVQLELVTNEPPTGTSARWVPDEPKLDFQSTSPPKRSDSPGFPDLNALPGAAQSAPAAKSAPGPLVAVEPTSPVASYQRRKKKKNWLAIGLMGGFALAGIVVVAVLMRNYEAPSPTADPTVAGPAPVENLEQPPAENEPYSRPRLENRPQLVAEFAPTEGKPLQLAMLPRGVNFVIHVRPALLWSDAYDYQVLKASLTDDVTNWIAATLKELCRREPQEIEEAYIGYLLGAGGTEPEVCAVVKLKTPAKLSALIEEFRGEYFYDIMDRPDLRLKVDDKYAYLIKDESTIAISPATYAGELEESMTHPFSNSVPMENLLRETDAQRLFTMVGVVRDFGLHYKGILPAAAHPFAEQVLEWIGEDVEALSWSFHPEPYLHSELLLHPVTSSNPAKLQARINTQFAKLPEQLWKEVCLKMSPQEMRFRNFIGRLPAMLEAYRQATVGVTTANFVRMTTVLPAKAAPNLALATLFTVNEAARTDFTAEVVMVAETKPNLPETVAERLRLTVDAEFNRTPLEQALQYLADEIQVQLFVDGDALKDAGYTKNMPQTFNLGKVPAERAFAEIINTYQEAGKIMVMSIDEQQKLITVQTLKFAEAKGMPVYKPRED